MSDENRYRSKSPSPKDLVSDSFTLDAINSNSDIGSHLLVDMYQAMQCELERILVAQTIPIGWIKSASVTFRFLQDDQKIVTIDVPHSGNHTLLK